MKYRGPLAIVVFFFMGCTHMKGPHIDRQSFAFATETPSVVQQNRDGDKRRENPLYLPSRRVQPEEIDSPPLHAFIATLYRTMKEKAGIGIAANQLGKNIQAFIIEAKTDNPRYKILGPVPYGVFLNPRIVAASNERRNFWHACLSAVGENRGNVATYEWIEIEATGPAGQPIRTRLEGLAAVIFQHEFRHLLGGTYLDQAHQFLSKDEFDRALEKKEIPFFERAENDLPLLIGDYRVGETLEDYYARTKAPASF